MQLSSSSFAELLEVILLFTTTGWTHFLSLFLFSTFLNGQRKLNPAAMTAATRTSSVIAA